MAQRKIEFSDEEDNNASKVVEDIYEAYNKQYNPAPHDRESFSTYLYDGGQVVGGIEGHSSWNWMFIKMIAIQEKYRRHGYGLQLLNKAENEAIKRKCTGIYLVTTSFQAPDFYQKAGYEEFGRLENYLPGHQMILFKKKLSCRT